MNIRARLLYSVARVYWWLFRPVTMGVRLLLIRDGQVLLVKHTYQAGWYLPGGGVKRKELLEEVARREAWEEIGARLGELRLFGIYSNLRFSKSDHIIVFLCEDYVIEGSADFEIASVERFPLDALPGDVNEGSLGRIKEYMNGVRYPMTAEW